jgi:serine/threonine protein kinase/beta-lactam-binding protein with PASTA domain
MATVYLALDIRLDRTVALKVMHRSLAEDPAFVRRFIGEAKSVASLSHPNVVHVFDQGTDGDVVYLSMEYVPGRTLRDILRDRGRLPAREALEILIPVLAALGAAHQAGMVHRDVKPENVLMTDDGRVKVVDFGLARAIEATNQTRTGVMIGTIAYMSPEQVMTGGADVRSDVYAAGIVLFELVTGEQPYDGETPMSVAYRHVHDTVPPPSSVTPDVPPLIDTLVAHATAREPDDRPKDATAMLVAAVDAHRMLPRTSGGRMPYTGTHSSQHPSSASAPYAPASAPTGSSPHGLPMHAGSGARSSSAARPVANPTLIQPRGEARTESHEPSGRRARFRPNWFLVALAVVLVVAVALTGWFFAQPTYVKVPDLVGKDMALAEETALRAGFKVNKVKGVNDEKIAEGLVLRTDPGVRQELEAGATITLVPSLGPKRVLVPNVTGMAEADARTAIATSGLTVGAVKRLPDLTVERGKTIRTSPQVGDRIKEGAKVSIFVSAGLVMPNVNGMPKDEATAFLGGQGFQVQVNEVDDDAEPCTVIAQTPKAKSEVDRGAPTMITVSRCQNDFWNWFRGGQPPDPASEGQPAVVPSVMGKSFNDARHDLEALGFKVQIRSLVGDGVVHFQRPAGDSPRPPGSTVILWQ